MTTTWIPHETTSHQDHVIAHVIGATVLGHFSFDESLYLVLDIGFVWRVYLDGEMGLLPGTLAIQELEGDNKIKQLLKSDVELLLSRGIRVSGLEQVAALTIECTIEEVRFFANADKRCLMIQGEEDDLMVETSLETREFKLYPASRSK